MRTFQHETCVYGTDEEFLAMAVPFVEDALKCAEPVLVTTTPHNLELLGGALGGAAGRVDSAETAYFGRRAAHRIGAFHRWWKPRSSTGRPARILAEPIWHGRTVREARTWRWMESALNAVFAAADLRMICPYDTRSVPAEIVAESLRTHPGRVSGTEVAPSEAYVPPADFARGFDPGPLPAPPPDAAALSFAGELRGVRRFVAAQAAERGLAADRAALFVAAVSEVAAHIRTEGAGAGTIKIWDGFGSIHCEVHEPGGRADDPFVGLRPPALEARSGDGLWLTRQICDFVDIRNDETGCAYRLQLPSVRVVE